jgi:hypothetical protein
LHPSCKCSLSSLVRWQKPDLVTTFESESEWFQTSIFLSPCRLVSCEWKIGDLNPLPLACHAKLSMPAWKPHSYKRHGLMCHARGRTASENQHKERVFVAQTGKKAGRKSTVNCEGQCVRISAAKKPQPSRNPSGIAADGCLSARVGAPWR